MRAPPHRGVPQGGGIVGLQVRCNPQSVPGRSLENCQPKNRILPGDLSKARVAIQRVLMDERLRKTMIKRGREGARMFSSKKSALEHIGLCPDTINA
jgi:hypothetical protein